MKPSIQVQGARVHNLKNLDVAIPLNALTVVTGVSGSGKSSLAFDTLYAEGQRRYVESLSAYARQFLERMEKPDVDAIVGIAPAVAIRQKNSSRNPRSTVATATEIYDYLRLLFARVGRTYCPDCGLPAERNDVDSAADAVLAESAGRRVLILFPVEAGEPGKLTARLTELRGKGFPRLWQSGTMVEFSRPESLLELDLSQPLFVVADRLAVEPEARQRIVEAIETAYREAGQVQLWFPDTPELGMQRFTERFECNRCGRKFESPEPLLFSFNNPYGACPTCQGFGKASAIAVDRVVPDPGLSLNQGAIEPWNRPRGLRWRNALKRFAAATGLPLNRPWRELSAEDRRRIWEGEGKFPGVLGFFAHLEHKKYKVHVRVFLSRYREYSDCPDCHGGRLRPEALWVRLAATWRCPERQRASPAGERSAPSERPTGATPAKSGEPLRSTDPDERHNIASLTRLTVEQAGQFFERIKLSPQEAAIAQSILIEVRRRLEFLRTVGLEYLTLDRRAATLSGGEAQRIQLATCLGSQLVGALYVLDEPSIGLHPRDTRRLIAILHELRDLGNTILVVEHDPEVMRASDHLLDLGPAAGEQGGELVAQGSWREICESPQSLTGQYLRGARRIPIPAQRRPPGRSQIVVQGASAHNLKNVDVGIPLGLLVAVTGVSGSGKSTLVHDILHHNLQRAMRAGSDANQEDPGWMGCRGITGLGHLNEVTLVDQSPIGRTPRSNPVTYVKAFDGIRELFAKQPEARKRGLRAGHFSFNVPGGRCETCQGDGVVTVDMQFLADVALVCEECGGARFQAGTLAVEVKGKNIHQVLQLSVRAALEFFAGHDKIVRPLRLLDEIGLGYLRLGQSATTLSGGEAQRVKLAAHLAQPRSADRTLFLFDEPTTGLHFDDIAKLLSAFQRLIAAGGSVLVIEHNLEVIKAADWIIDLGPEAGERGGRVVAEGPPEWVAQAAESRTAPFLVRALAPDEP